MSLWTRLNQATGLGAAPPAARDLCLGFLALLILYRAVSTLRTWYRLRAFRGPFLASISHLWLMRTTLSGRAYKIQMGLRERYGAGSLIRIGPNMLIHDDPGVYRQLNGGARSRYVRSEWYQVMRFDPYQHTVFSSLDVKYHDDIKSKTASGYAGRDVPTLEGDINEQLESLKRLIRGKYLSAPGESRPIDFSQAVLYFTLDSLTKIAYGKECGGFALLTVARRIVPQPKPIFSDTRNSQAASSAISRRMTISTGLSSW
jgi:hypothetical protein